MIMTDGLLVRRRVQEVKYRFYAVYLEIPGNQFVGGYFAFYLYSLKKLSTTNNLFRSTLHCRNIWGYIIKSLLEFEHCIQVPAKGDLYWML